MQEDVLEEVHAKSVPPIQKVMVANLMNLPICICIYSISKVLQVSATSSIL